MDPAHQANDLLHEGLSKYFTEPLPPNLGREVYGTIQWKVRSEGIRDESHVQEIFATVLFRVIEHFQRNPSATVDQPRAWIHQIARNESSQYLLRISRQESSLVEAMLGGRISYAQMTRREEEQILRLIPEVVPTLRPRHQEFIYLDFVQCLSPEQIQDRMKIKSPGYFRKLKCEALKALRTALQAAINQGISSLF